MPFDTIFHNKKLSEVTAGYDFSAVNHAHFRFLQKGKCVTHK